MEQLQEYARRRKCDGIICGHIHTPADERIGEVHYLNCGDWVETLSAVVEHDDGRFEVLYYDDFLSRLAAVERGAEGVSEAAVAKGGERAFRPGAPGSGSVPDQ